MDGSSVDGRLENIQIVAHRGFSGIYPENTLIAFKKAIELGVYFLEIDIRQTSDGEPVVMHDEKIDRTTDGTGYVRELTFSQLRKFDAGKWKGFSGEKIPHLEEVLELANDATGILIEIKECDVEKLGKFLNKRKNRKFYVGSFHVEYVKKIREIIPEIPTSFICGHIPTNLPELVSYGIRKLDIQFGVLNADIVKTLVSSGFLVNSWTPDSKEDLLLNINMGVQFITTNRPDILKEILYIRKK
ncbi:MAG TPA: glycerophosphodiester phosphodiesterase family protein [bacterium]|nr:glycerophosphodiester phosphodiesterase family protein [bacterium]HOL49493.1 glycerophosphodiester phosphodiesterase family protein [bacterium]HPO52236.1 glycerophosphodiester phosphodiesterase family protein [bacterium]HXK45070.1 glycerophosphodiester phosphodiesterase family protein [bacterium]